MSKLRQTVLLSLSISLAMDSSGFELVSYMESDDGDIEFNGILAQQTETAVKFTIESPDSINLNITYTGPNRNSELEVEVERNEITSFPGGDKAIVLEQTGYHSFTFTDGSKTET